MNSSFIRWNSTCFCNWEYFINVYNICHFSYHLDRYISAQTLEIYCQKAPIFVIIRINALRSLFMALIGIFIFCRICLLLVRWQESKDYFWKLWQLNNSWRHLDLLAFPVFRLWLTFPVLVRWQEFWFVSNLDKHKRIYLGNSDNSIIPSDILISWLFPCVSIGDLPFVSIRSIIWMQNKAFLNTSWN